MDSLFRFGHELVSGPHELADLLRRLIAEIEPVAQSAPVLVFLYDPALSRFTPHQTGGSVPTEAVGLSFERDSALARWLIETRSPLSLSDPEGQPLIGQLAPEERDPLERLGLTLFLPLLTYGGRPGPRRPLNGWLALGSRPSGEAYGADEVRFMAVLADLTALALDVLRLDERIQEAQQDKAEFIDFVAHELNQPMTAIHGYAKMLTMGIGGELSDTHRQFVQVISANTGRMGKLISDLLESSRLEAGRIQLRPAPVPVVEIVDEVLAHIQPEIEARHHTLELDVSADLPAVQGDRGRLIQVLTHLVRNACQYTPEGGTIRITASRPDHRSLPVDHLLISISDTGIGMSPEELAKLEHKFFRANQDLVRAQPGTGLGVSIARHLVALHGGAFMVESEPGQGSTFGFTLPIAQGQGD